MRPLFPIKRRPSDPWISSSKLKYFLSPNGLIYLVVPNAAKPSVKKGFRTSFLRPVHISYFCAGNILLLAYNAGLSAFKIISNGEITALLAHVKLEQHQKINYYTQQKELFISSKKTALFKDIFMIMNILIKYFFLSISKLRINRIFS